MTQKSLHFISNFETWNSGRSNLPQPNKFSQVIQKNFKKHTKLGQFTNLEYRNMSFVHVKKDLSYKIVEKDNYFDYTKFEKTVNFFQIPGHILKFHFDHRM